MRYSMHVYYPDGSIWNVTKEYPNGLAASDIAKELSVMATNRLESPADYPDSRYQVTIAPIL